MATETLGSRMRAAAKARRASAYRIAQQLGVYPQTVYDWWKDEYRPEPHRLQAYAAALGVTMSELGADEQQAIRQQEAEALAQDILVVAFAGVVAGEAPDQAFARAAEGARAFTETERGVLTAAAPQIRDYLNQLAGGDWNALTTDQQRLLVERLMAPTPITGAPPNAPPEPTSG